MRLFSTFIMVLPRPQGRSFDSRQSTRPDATAERGMGEAEPGKGGQTSLNVSFRPTRSCPKPSAPRAPCVTASAGRESAGICDGDRRPHLVSDLVRVIRTLIEQRHGQLVALVVSVHQSCRVPHHRLITWQCLAALQATRPRRHAAPQYPDPRPTPPDTHARPPSSLRSPPRRVSLEDDELTRGIVGVGAHAPTIESTGVASRGDGPDGIVVCATATATAGDRR